MKMARMPNLIRSAVLGLGANVAVGAIGLYWLDVLSPP